MANTPTTDLTDVYTDGDTDWAELTGFGGGAAPAENLESFIQGNSCVSQSVSTGKTGAASGMEYDNLADITAFTDNTDVFLFWWLFLFPEAINDYNETVGQTAPSSNSPGTASGYFIGIGSSAGNANYWAVGGADYARYPYGGWQNVAIDPTRSPSWTDGSPTASTYQFFNYLPNIISAPSRGQSNVADAIRYGRGTITYTGGAPAGTFSDLAATNDLNANRWGLFQEQAGSFLWKGRMQLGTGDSSLLFDDINANISCDATRQAYSTFNLIEINNASSSITWENVTINKLKGLGSLDVDSSRGDLQVSNDATTSLTGCSFTDMGFFNWGSNSTNTDVTFRRCNVIRQNGATITGCDFESTFDSAHALHVSDSANDLPLVTGCKFTATSNRSNHAIRLGSVAQTKTIAFTDNELIGYTSGSTGTFVGTTGTDSAAIEVNVSTGETLTLNVAGTSTTPSIQNTGAGTVIVQQVVTVTISGVLGNSEISVLDNPSPYSTTSLPAPSVTTLSSTETVSADTIVGDGTNSVTYSNNGGFVQINAAGTSSFSGVLTDGDIDGTALSDGDTVRVTVRDNSANPRLDLFDEFEVDGTPAPSASAILTKTSFATFTSTFGTQLNAANSLTTTVEKKDARYQFIVSADEVIDFLVFRTGSDPISSLNQTITSTNNSFPISQVQDRNFRNPA